MWVRDDDGTEVKLAFSGDIGPGNRPLIKDPEYIKEADYVIMESTYGDRKHNTPPDFAIALAKVIKETLYERGGNLVVPAFSVGRTQEMLCHLPCAGGYLQNGFVPHSRAKQRI